MTGTLQDLRYATRGLRKSPGFMVVAALTLALGIGANVAVFTVMNAILLNPSGIPHPESVIALRAKYSLADLSNINISAPDFGDAVTGKDVVTSAAVLQAANFNYSGKWHHAGEIGWRECFLAVVRCILGQPLPGTGVPS